ncbi:cell elongation-specific peptidoglycan biosynthesis regulator RodA [Desulfofundulus australicus DSM 11792]|uniref:Cell elongation-specific peptidoglycan biosynthesis regulator RodA n=1 Tax=Desulfofundulus australicus DSM 11792 TaxID=1121425 RepID=A0A1M4U2E2_9FIRM|nr:FtsW/RodA/SpoVE family cell cycle protein [Desulfofundulus australicus]SHE50878.1 cell elongation-specific peptidoglycan biosynthesis regulator RodA [Desulfofundulus australicus DSM 11792]
MTLSAASRLRAVERKLLYWVSAYLLIGAGTLYLWKPLLPALVVLAGALIAMIGFWILHLFWCRFNFAADPFLLPLVAFFSSTSLIFLYRLNPAYAERQFVWLMTGLFALWVVTRYFLHYRLLAEYKYIYALAGIIGLLLPIFFGIEQGGAKSWLDLGFFQVQPSEFVKILLVLFLAAFLAENRLALAEGTQRIWGITLPAPQEWGPMLIMWGISLLLLIFQKDLGAALIYFTTFLAMVYASTARVAYVCLGGALFLAGAAAAYFLFEHVRLRIGIWLDPWQQAEAAGYQVVQSLFALTAGGITGTGLGAGMPQFIPAVHTDFIFAAIAEELGLAGSLGLIMIYMLFVYRGFLIALAAKDDFACLLAAGFTALMGLQTFIIIAGVIKLLPLTGITLPFLSYGGSSLVANFIILGFLLNISHEVQITSGRS